MAAEYSQCTEELFGRFQAMVKAQRQEAALPGKPMAMVVRPQAAQASSTLCPFMAAASLASQEGPV